MPSLDMSLDELPKWEQDLLMGKRGARPEGQMERLKELESKIRTFESGATRDTEDGKLDFEAFLSPLVLLRYAEYMHEHRRQSDDGRREGDNWQKGIPRDAYMKSLMRHVMDVWLLHRGQNGVATNDIETALCGVIFNAMGYLFNELEGLE